MQIRITDLPIEGRRIEDTLSLESLNDRMNLGSGNDILFLREPEIDLFIKPAPGGAIIKGTITTSYQQPCARCLDNIDEKLTLDVELVCKEEKEDDESNGGSIADDNAGVLHYKGDYIDLEESIQELLILKLSPFKSPPKNDAGDCTLCGLNFEKEYSDPDDDAPASSSMGSILQDALNKKKTQH